MVSKHALDFSNVKESSGINPKRKPAGDYLAKIVSVDETTKDDIPMWMFLFQLSSDKNATYPYYCKLQENQLWKVRNLLVAAGKTVPKKRVVVDPSKLVNSEVGITLEDDEYEGKVKSVIEAVFPASELAGESAEEDIDEELDDDDDEPTPAPKKSKKAAPAAAAPAKKKKPKKEADDELDLDEL